MIQSSISLPEAPIPESDLGQTTTIALPRTYLFCRLHPIAQKKQKYSLGMAVAIIGVRSFVYVQSCRCSVFVISLISMFRSGKDTNDPSVRCSKHSICWRPFAFAAFEVVFSQRQVESLFARARKKEKRCAWVFFFAELTSAIIGSTHLKWRSIVRPYTMKAFADKVLSGIAYRPYRLQAHDPKRDPWTCTTCCSIVNMTMSPLSKF